jgi:dihydroorotate dehydrogenase
MASNFFQKVVRPTLFRLDAERAHELGLKALEIGIASLNKPGNAEIESASKAFGAINRFGLEFKNPVGVAAGFDKNGRVVNRLADLGFGFVEVGTVTYRPQPGNPKPRLFRLPDDKALINRLGFNNDGAITIAARLSLLKRNCVIGVNIGRNKDVANEDAIENYLQTFDAVHAVADYLVVNVSSPNTPNLRDLQSPENLESLITRLRDRNELLGKKPLLIKIAPDLGSGDLAAIVDLCLRLEVSGIIATNTTVSRENLRTSNVQKFGAGGLSGRPLGRRSDHIISQIYKHSNGKLPIIGVGGVFSAEDAFKKIAAGASLVQAYTGFIYAGPSFASDVVIGLAVKLKQRGFRSIDDAIGSGTG